MGTCGEARGAALQLLYQVPHIGPPLCEHLPDEALRSTSLHQKACQHRLLHMVFAEEISVQKITPQRDCDSSAYRLSISK